MNSSEHTYSIDPFWELVSEVTPTIDTGAVIAAEIANNTEIKRIIRLLVMNERLSEADAQSAREALLLRVAQDYDIQPALCDRAFSNCEWMIEYEEANKYGQA